MSEQREPGADGRDGPQRQGGRDERKEQDARQEQDARCGQGEKGEPEPEPHGARCVDDPGRGLRHRWRTFTHTPFFPATVLALIVAAAAGLFAGSYTYAMADPTPRAVPAAVQGDDEDVRRVGVFTAGLEKALGSSLQIRRYRTFAQARQAVEEQKVFAVLRPDGPGQVELGVSSAAGASVAEVLQRSAPKVGRETGVDVTVRDLKPLGKGDPRGLTIFYMTLAADIIGFIGAIQLSVNVPGLSPVARVSFIAAYALLGGFVIAVMVSWVLDAVPLPFVHSWSILALTMVTSGMVFLMFNSLIGRWAMIPTWFLMVLLGNPSSGGAVSWPLLPSVLGAVGRWLPPGASVNAQHTAVYFPGNQHAMPYLVLAAWALAGGAVFFTLDARRRGGLMGTVAGEP
ncbi:ABC transporter permease [Streptomyces marispadix]|uniref:ABC transporter permease n=1 Tax=Streptomyces marispadix TaxID=2922868 RepID=A0ABS9SY44_9ACTN|nr:ABC transporter permease [Streptomyces marispadix]MCH6161194.1 ABC transporter permease [Streptomyces marispadix]